MRKLKPLPVFNGRTALGLLAAVKRAILAEPKRADMQTFAEQVAPEHGGPACGTVGCFAGWVGILGAPSSTMEDDIDFQGYSDADALRLLGHNLIYDLPASGANRLNFYVFNSGSGDDCENTQPGTKAHAQAVVARIDRFIQVNYKALKKRRLPKNRRKVS